MDNNEVGLYWGHSEISAEVDEYGELDRFDIYLNNMGASMRRCSSRKKRDKKSFYTTGIPQVGPTEPNPPDREDMIRAEFSQIPWTKNSWVGYVATVIAVAFDSICFISLFDGVGRLWSIVMCSMAAALAIDVIPMFFAQTLDDLGVKRRTVYKWIIGITLALFTVVIFMMIIVRFDLLKDIQKNINRNLILTAVPAITSFASFVANYTSYHPDDDILKKYKINEMHRMESICELKAMIVEIDADANYEARLLAENEDKYQTMCKLIDDLAKRQKDSIRVMIAEKLKSPADTSDLTS